MEEDCKLNEKEKKYFIIFLIIHLIVWSVLPLIRHLLPVDAMEGIVWGSYLDFGTHKHPPLAGWITYFFYQLFNQSDYIIYLIGQICVLIGFLYTYKLAEFFMDKKRALCSVMILEGCFTYSYMSIFDGFNPNFLIIALFPAIGYYFYKAINFDKLSDWLLLGVFTGLAGLSKYQSILLVFGMFLVVSICKKYRHVLYGYKLYLSAFAAGLINIPHVLWLIKNDFFSWKYFEDEGTFTVIKRLSALVTFSFEQILAIIGTLIIFGVLYYLYRKDKIKREINCPRNFRDKAEGVSESFEWRFRQRSSGSACDEQDEQAAENCFYFENAVFIIVIGCVPLVTQALMSAISGSRLIGTWGYPMLFMIGIGLYYFFPIKISDKYFSAFVKSVYTVMGIMFLIFFILFSVEKNFRSSYPYEIIYKDLAKIYKQETGQDLKYVAGYIEFALPLTIYGENHPQIIFDTYGHKNIWINEDDVKKSGVLVVSMHDDVDYKRLIPYDNNENSEYHTYKFTIQNKLKQKRDYDLFYKIIYR